MALNPIAFTERVVDDFLHYQLTTYPLADLDLYNQLWALLKLEETRKTPLRKGPFVSLSRPFKPGATVVELVEERVFHPQMQAVVPYEQLRAHQERAIRSVQAGRTTLISTGTGSGKTEAFLYPIINRCLELQEASAPSGVVAVIVYPMNSLAEDQLDRLRGLLAGRGISFGMYVGKTPEEESQVRGERMPFGTTNAAYHERLTQIRAAGQGFALLPSEERASRKAMRADGGQPRILLTNVKQLELLLTRGKDVGIFADAPLEFLVFDEAHTFRGAQGAETACLVRRLRTFCGREPHDVRHIATSATLADPASGDGPAKDFARRFFGVDAERVEVVPEIYDELRWNERRHIPDGPPEDAHAVLAALLKAVDAPDSEVAEAISVQLVALGGARLRREGWQAALASQLAGNELVYQLASALEKPRALADLPDLLVEKLDRPVPEAEILAWLALGAACGRGGHDPLLRPVVHSFVRGVGGAVVTFSGPAARLWLSGEDAHSELGEDFRRFPLITCTTCGQHYYETWVKDFALLTGSKAGPVGGDRVDTLRLWEHLPAEIGGTRVILVDRLIVRPDEEEDVEEVDEDGEVLTLPAGHEFEHRRLHPLFVCGRCGSLQEERTDACAACNAQNAQVAVQAVRTREDLPGLLHSCVACQAPGKRPQGGRYREPARPVRAVSVSDVHVLAQSMVHLSERPRLLVFADSRQDAAFQAGWMRDHARRFRLRALVARQIVEGATTVGDVVYQLDDLFDKDRDLSRALLPEVWQVVPFDESGTKHREERLYFLRIQVLREVATGVKQRLGLEPWGRLKVGYRGLMTELPFVAKWARVLGVADEALVEGIAALLDHLRRVRVLHDETTGLFERRWSDGDKQVQYGYLPRFPGGPRGVKLSRTASDSPARATQWIGSRPTQVWNAVAAWGVPERDLETFLEELWACLCERQLLVPVTLTGWGKPLEGSAGIYQIDSSQLILHPHTGRYRCERCRRTTVRQGPTGVCMAWRCGGRLVREDEVRDDFDLRLLDGDYALLRVAEHSAQVPHDKRESIENQFKGEGEQLNVLVCTPTLELGVDIGTLDAVLMRNVPPTAANYWQRAGRAGRRHRMAVDLTYAQANGFDQAYFREPLKLLGGQVEPPRFNLKNEMMIRKHVHATVLTALHGVARSAGPEVRRDIEGTLGCCFPATLRSYLFTPGGEILPEVRDVGDLGAIIAAHRGPVFAAVKRSFTQAWPGEDAAAVSATLLERMVDEMPASLQAVLKRFKRRLDWALGELQRLGVVKLKKGDLDSEDKAHERRCEKVIARLKGTTYSSARNKAQGGPDDSETMGALAREGFLPGYGLESGSLIGTAEPPRMTQGLDDFDLPRPPSLALREYVPGNAIYANGFRFVPRRFLLTPEETLRFRVLVDQQVVQELGVDTARAPLAEQELRAVPVCDVILPTQSQISDEEEFRFQMAVAIYGNDRGFHRGGTSWTWGRLDIRFRRGVQLRLVNVGPRKEVEQTRLGFPLCLACGQSQSPFASGKSRQEFEKLHQERCGHVVQPTGFFADVEVDILGLHDVADRQVGFSVVEALRMGAARVLDMEIEDLQVIAIGHVGEDACDVLLYDPMPGGSGLLEQLAERWEEVRNAALEILTQCPGACTASCVDCLQTYRNRFYHRYLDRHVAAQILAATSGPLVEAHPIPESLPKTSSTTGQSQTWIENRFQQFLSEAGIPAPFCQHHIDLGAGFGCTIPDFFYGDEDEEEKGICIYLDGMAGHIHGNPEQADKDSAIRSKLDNLGYEVVVVRSFELDDKAAVVRAVARIAKYLVGREKQRSVRNDTSWFDRIVAGGAASPPTTGGSEPTEPAGVTPFRLVQPTPETRYVNCVPFVPLKAAAGGFGDAQHIEKDGFEWISIDSRHRLRPGMFVAQVVGRSMEPLIPDGALCLFRAPVEGTRQGKTVLVQLRDAIDHETGERYTVKRYESEKSIDGDLWRQAKITLKPVNPAFKPIFLTGADAGELQVIAELIEVLGGTS